MKCVKRMHVCTQQTQNSCITFVQRRPNVVQMYPLTAGAEYILSVHFLVEHITSVFKHVNPLTAKLFNLNFHSPEVVSC